MRRRLAALGGIAVPAPAGIAALVLAGSFGDSSPVAFLIAAVLNLVLFIPWLLVQLQQALPVTMRALDVRLATWVRRRGRVRRLRAGAAMTSRRNEH
jgi:hypothetical protein